MSVGEWLNDVIRPEDDDDERDRDAYADEDDDRGRRRNRESRREPDDDAPRREAGREAAASRISTMRNPI